MAGHSKWANIKHRKGAQDAKRGAVFTKLIREITVAARNGGADPGANNRLRAAITAARAQNLPKETIERAIKRGAGGLDGTDYQEQRFEGYGPGGVAVLVETMSDNNQRTVANIKHIFSRFGGNLGTTGCVAFMFDKKGLLVYEGVDENALMEAALEAGAEDVIVDDGTFEVLTAPDDFNQVAETLVQAGFANPTTAEVTMRPQTTTPLEGKKAESMLKLLDMMEEDEDVQKVYANFDISDEELERLGNLR